MKTTILVFVLLVKICSNLDNLSNPSSNNLANNQADALLQTAFVKVGDLYLRKISKLNVLLDTVSQRTYIRNDLKNYLNLPVLQNEQILIWSIWTKDTRVKNNDIVPLKITSATKTTVIEAICKPPVCSNFLNQHVKIVSSNYEYLKQLELGDFSPESTKCTGVLMGVDYYYSWCLNGCRLLLFLYYWQS